MARQTINVGTIANDGSGDTLRVAGTKMNQNFQELYNILGGDDLSAGSVTSFTDSGIDFPGVTHTLKLGFTEPVSGQQKLTLPNTTGTIVTNNATQTLTNKTLTQPAINGPTLHDPTLWDADSSHKYSIVAGSLTSNVNITLPNLTGNDVFTLNAQTQTLTNKTIQSPSINEPRIGASINDSNGSPLIHFVSVGSSVNHIDIENAINNQNPKLRVHGSSTNISLELSAKGNGVIAMASPVQYANNTIDSAAPTISSYMASPLTVFNHNATINGTIPDGSYTGQSKRFININSGAAVITNTGGNLGPYTSFTLSQ